MSEKLVVENFKTLPEISELLRKVTVYIGITQQYLEDLNEELRSYCETCLRKLHHLLEQELHELVIVQKQDISRDNFREFLSYKISMYLLEIEFNNNDDESLQRKSVIKALECGKECVDNQPDYLEGYHLYANAFFYLIDFAKFDSVVNDENERNYIKQVVKYGRQVAQSFRFALENANIPKKEIHGLFSMILKALYSNPKDLMPGEESEQFSLAKEIENMVNILKNQSDSTITAKGKDYLDSFHLNNSDSMLESKTFTLVIQILGFRPLIWRRFQVPGSITLPRLHDRVISPIMGWSRNYHAYYFRKVPFDTKFVFGPEKSKATDRWMTNLSSIHVVDDSNVKIGQLLKEIGDELLYVYDFGDNWKHKIYVEAIEDSGNQPITIQDGENNCPLEDCGSLITYTYALHAQLYGPSFDQNTESSPSNLKYEDYIRRIGKAVNYKFNKQPFDPHYFSLPECKRRLQNALRSDLSKQDSSNFNSFSMDPTFKTMSLVSRGKFKETKILRKKPIKECAICQSREMLKQCATCRCVFYCSREHQVKDWPNHKKICGKEK